MSDRVRVIIEGDLVAGATLEEVEHEIIELYDSETVEGRGRTYRVEAAEPAGEVIGYVILTSQVDGTWQDDWDGHVHVERASADAELADAATALGGEYVQLAALVRVER